MSKIEEFRNYYENYILPEVEELEKENMSVYYDNMKARRIAIFFWFLATGLLIYIKCYIFAPFSLLGFFISLLNRPTYSYKYLFQHRRQFKEKVIGKLVHFFDESFTYEPEKWIEGDEFKRSGLFSAKIEPNSFKGEDLISGIIEGSDVTFCEFSADYVIDNSRWEHIVRKGQIDDSSETKWVVDSNIKWNQNRKEKNIFRGLFFVGSFPEYFREEKIIELSNSVEELEKHRYIIPPSLEFVRYTFQKISISFKGCMLYIAVPFEKDFFEPAYDKAIPDFENMKEYYEIFEFIIEMFKHIIKNRERWLKG